MLFGEENSVTDTTNTTTTIRDTSVHIREQEEDDWVVLSTSETQGLSGYLLF